MAVNIYSGTASVVMLDFNSLAAWNAVEHEKITNSLMVTAMLNFILRVPDFEDFYRFSLRWIMPGEAPVPASITQLSQSLGGEVQQV